MTDGAPPLGGDALRISSPATLRGAPVVLAVVGP